MPREVDLHKVQPYADHLGDGLVQMSFTLPVPYSLAARQAALLRVTPRLKSQPLPIAAQAMSAAK